MRNFKKTAPVRGWDMTYKELNNQWNYGLFSSNLAKWGNYYKRSYV